jgi:hypothetical protein
VSTDNRKELLNYIHSNYALEDLVFYLDEQFRSDDELLMKLIKWLDKNVDLSIFRDFYQIEMGADQYELDLHISDE